MPILTNTPRITPLVGETLVLGPSDDDISRAGAVRVEIEQIRGRSLRVCLLAGESGSSAARLKDWCGGIVSVALLRQTSLHRFQAILRPARRGSGAPQFILEGRTDLESIQRRREYRLPLRQETRIQPKASTGRPYGESPAIAGHILNLSAGGALIACAAEYKAGDILTLDIPRGREGWVEPLRAEVVSCEADEGTSSKKRYEVRLQFDNGDQLQLSEETREEIVKYIFEQQRILLQVRKLMFPTGSATPSHKKRSRIMSAFTDLMRAPSQGWKL